MDKTRIICFLILLVTKNATAVTHSLKYFYTASSGIPTFPSYVSVGLVDDVQISYCDSFINENIPKQEWMNRVSSEYPRYWEEETDTCLAKYQTFKFNLEIAKQRFNQTEGVHIFQQMYGCEWEDETEQITSYDQFGFDGEDLIQLDPSIPTWLNQTSNAVLTKNKWDNDRAALQHEKFYLTQTCVEWLKKYVSYGRSYLMNTDLPSVSFLQKSSSSPISCHATGFYPNRAEMFWRKDGEEIHDGVVKGEILPNNDGTFQMTVDIDLSSVSSEDWNKYECVFQLSGVKEDITERLEKTRILTNEWETLDKMLKLFSGTRIIQKYLSNRLKPPVNTQDTKTSTPCPETSSLTSVNSDDSQDIASSQQELLKRETNKLRTLNTNT